MESLVAESAPSGRTASAVAATPAPVPWGMTVALGALVFSFFAEVVGVVLIRVITLSVGATTLVTRHEVEFSLVAYQFLALGVAVCALFLLGVHFHLPPSSLGFRNPGSRALVRSAAVVPVVLVGVALISGFFDTFIPGYQLRGNARELLQGSGSGMALGWKLAVAAWAVLEAPLVEETLFRGIMYQGLRSFFSRWLSQGWAVASAAALSGLIFGAVHFEPHTFPILAFLGVVLALVFQSTRSIYASALIHGAVNLLAVISVFTT